MEDTADGTSRAAGEDPIVVAATQDWVRRLRETPPPIADVIAWQARNHLVGDGPLCRVLRPNLVTAAQLEADRHATETFLAVLRQTGDRVAADPALRERYLGSWWDKYAELLELDHDHPQGFVIGRADAFATPAGLQFFEYNLNPDGTMRVDAATRMYEQLAVFQRFAPRWELAPLRTLPPLGQAFLAVFAAAGGHGLPVVVWLVAPSARQSKLRHLSRASLAASSSELGFPLHFVDPAELTFEGGRLRHGSLAIDLVSRNSMDELIEQGMPALAPLIAAVRARAVCLVNRFSIYEHKALFAAMTDPDCSLGVPAAAQKAVRAHVPWTRVVRDEQTTDPSGAPIALGQWACEKREQLVFKPCMESGGKGVLLGWQTAAADWEQALRQAASGRATHIVQARIPTRSTAWPQLAAGFPEGSYLADRCPFVAAGQFSGYFTRINTGGLTNISAGATFAPTFIVRGKL